VKILFICNGFTVKMSGGDYHMIKVAHNWSKGNVIYFLIPKLGYEFIGELLTGKVCVYNTPLESEPIGMFKGIILYILRTLRASFFDVDDTLDIIVASSHYPFDVVPAMLHTLRNPRSKLVVYFHGLSIPEGAPVRKIFSYVYNLLGFLLFSRRSHLIFVVNSKTKDYLLQHGVKNDQIAVTTNGVDVIENAVLEADTVFDACFVGRLVKNKGVFDLISIWSGVCKKRPTAKLAILGDGPEKEQLAMLVIKMGLEKNVTFFGFVFGTEKSIIVANSKIFLFPSYLESWGISIAEAMAAGLPVVAYNLHVYKEVFEDKLVTVPLGDVDALAKQIIFLLENPDFATKIGEASREFVKRYDWKTVSEKELSVMINLINKR